MAGCAWGFDSDGPYMTGTTVIEGRTIGPYVSRFLGPTDGLICLNLDEVQNAAGDSPSDLSMGRSMLRRLA